MPARNTNEGVEKVYSAAEKWIDAALRNDDSLFTPGKSIWTRELLAELRECYLDTPDSSDRNFYDKLKDQLEDRSPQVYQLMAEVLYAHYLIIWREGMRADTKIRHLEDVLGWSDNPVQISEDLVEGMEPGIVRIGPAYGRLLPFMVGFLVEFVDRWKEQALTERHRLLDDPWEFKDFATRIEPRGVLFLEGPNSHGSQRESLLHLVFPDTFEGTASVQQKEAIAAAKAFAHFIPEGTSDVDRKLAQIRLGLEDGLGRDFGFYDRDIRDRWDPSASDAWDEYIRLASRVLESGNMWKDELGYKYAIAGRLASARKAVLNNADNWAELVKSRNFGNLIYPITQAKFKDWLDDYPQDALSALRAIWANDNSSLAERIRAFDERFPSSAVSGTGTRMNVISCLLMALDPELYPPFMVSLFDDAYKRTGYEARASDADEAAYYEHALGFLDRFTEEARSRGLPVRHRLDAQSLVWKVPYQEREESQQAARLAQELEELNEEKDAETHSSSLRFHLSLDDLAEALFLPTAFLREINDLLTDKRQVIFQGPPGTGKTYVAQQLANHLAGDKNRVTFVQFHPSYAYEDFVRGFRPKLENDQSGFELVDGPLIQAAKRAKDDDDNDRKHFLIIDEINRGSIAKVFGELYYLLEYRDEEISLQYRREEGETFSLPKNLYIIGTMNTADRSIALVDLALRRRFYFVEFHPDEEPIKSVLRQWLEENAPDMKWVAGVVERTNDMLKDDRHAAIGPSYFMRDGLDDDAVERIWKHSVLPYIEERRFGGEVVTEEFSLARLRRQVEPSGGSPDTQGEPQNGDDGADDASA